MNVIFCLLFIACAVILAITQPTSFLPALLDGASKSGATCVGLIATYSVWLGLMKVWEDSGVTRAISKLLKPLAKKLFLVQDDETLTAVSMNLSANCLGLAGVATPYGIKAAKLLDKQPNAEYASAMLFVLAATSIQIFPTSMVAMRTALKSGAPADIVLPTLLTTTLSTLLGVALTYLFLRPKREKEAVKTGQWKAKKVKKAGAGI
jgi:spore maturation protein A